MCSWPTITRLTSPRASPISLDCWATAPVGTVVSVMPVLPGPASTDLVIPHFATPVIPSDRRGQRTQGPPGPSPSCPAEPNRARRLSPRRCPSGGRGDSATRDVVGLGVMTATESQTEVQPADPPEQRPALEIPEALPLQPEDPPRVGEFWLRGRLGANAAGYLYTASDEAGRNVVVAMMTEGSADDAAARDRFVYAVDDLPEEAVLGHNDADDDDLALWVAVGPIREDDGSSAASDERLIAERRGEEILSAVLMDRVPQIGKLRGPEFRHYWESRRRPGLFRIWPLPWPNALRPASRWALAFALLTMALIMVLAVFLA